MTEEKKRTTEILMDLLSTECRMALDGPYDVKGKYRIIRSIESIGVDLMRTLPDGEEKEQVKKMLMDVVEHIHERAKERKYTGDDLATCISHIVFLCRSINQEF